MYSVCTLKCLAMMEDTLFVALRITVCTSGRLFLKSQSSLQQEETEMKTMKVLQVLKLLLTGLIGYSVILRSSNRSPYRIQCNSSSNRSPYRIQCNSSSNRSPYRIQCNSSSNRSPYRIQCNSSSNRSPYRIQCNSSSSRSPYRIQCNSSSNRSPYRIQCNSSSNRSPYRIQCNSSSNRSPYSSYGSLVIYTAHSSVVTAAVFAPVPGFFVGEGLKDVGQVLVAADYSGAIKVYVNCSDS